MIILFKFCGYVITIIIKSDEYLTEFYFVKKKGLSIRIIF